ncbi:IclR family transcriptional regulator [Cellulomonas chengniuliangii]|uniref:IclR family transcriptional regulator n=1 Tax=Cellulomonas chengniuliangii TaxID=2968084 RepID=UPI001D0F09BC|nr:IclR family transcriptional regulator [Cellulomonas chengniuliangii]MCC2317959.1 IclR family transcriptional regulator [Cellulomonas chengniuliangii]
MTETSSASPVESVDRALLALQALARAGSRGLTLAELASSLGLHKTTVHRALQALRYRGFAVQDAASGHYVLGPSATLLADDFLSDENLPLMLHPALVALSGDVDELVHLGVLSGPHVVYLDKVEPARPVRVWSAVGRRSPAVRTALGRALLAYRGADRAALAGYVRAGEEGTAPSTATATEEAAAVESAWEALEAARARGYATEREENEPGISCVAVPLLRSGSAIAAVSLTAPAERMTTERLEWLHGRMRAVLPQLLPAGLTLP